MNQKVTQEVKHVRRPRLAQAPIYELWLDQQWQQDDRYRFQNWFRWAWCRLDEVTELINKQFGVSWTRAEVLRRFAVPRERGGIQFGVGAKQRNYDLRILWIGEDSGEMHCAPYSQTDLFYVGEWNMSPYVPAGWVKDVLWAIFVGCTCAMYDKGNKVACLEDGTGVFYMVGAGKTH